jgi:hypothetical protein
MYRPVPRPVMPMLELRPARLYNGFDGDFSYARNCSPAPCEPLKNHDRYFASNT